MSNNSDSEPTADDGLPSHDELVEALASLEHEQWCHWTSTLAEREDLPDHLIDRWEANWCDYDDLDEETKEHDRKWARRAVAILGSNGVFPSRCLACGLVIREDDTMVMSDDGAYHMGCDMAEVHCEVSTEDSDG